MATAQALGQWKRILAARERKVSGGHTTALAGKPEASAEVSAGSASLDVIKTTRAADRAELRDHTKVAVVAGSRRGSC